jgi:hypothetical protein
MRQNRTKRAGIAVLTMPVSAEVPPIPNPDGREWHELTVRAWKNAWESPMAAQWLTTDVDALGRLALMWDAFYKEPDGKVLAEIRLQEQRFGLSPLDRSRLQWEVARTADAERKQAQKATKKPAGDPRAILMAV